MATNTVKLPERKWKSDYNFLDELQNWFHIAGVIFIWGLIIVTILLKIFSND